MERLEGMKDEEVDIIKLRYQLLVQSSEDWAKGYTQALVNGL